MFGLLAGFVGDGQFDGGYYADPEDECQAFHILHIGWSWRSGKSTASSDQMVHSSTRTISSVTGGSILTAPLLRISTLLMMKLLLNVKLLLLMLLVVMELLQIMQQLLHLLEIILLGMKHKHMTCSTRTWTTCPPPSLPA